MTNKYKKRTQGFTLVELSIVIIIIGFLIAGISGGTSLIRQAELNSVITDFGSFQTAYMSFVGRYNAVPGDMPNAFSYWGTNCSDTAADCNGNGDGLISDANANEAYAAWKELALAGMISSVPAGPINLDLVNSYNPGGDYRGLPVFGADLPASKISGAGYGIAAGYEQSRVVATWPANTFTIPDWVNTNAIFIGKLQDPNNDYGNFLPYSGAINAVDAFNLDQKLDDAYIDPSSGLFMGAASGKIRTMEGLYDPYYSCLLSAVLYDGPWTYNQNGTGTGCRVGIALPETN